MMITEMPVVMAGGGFPWGLLIIGGILYLLWRNGMFDGRGRRGPYGGYGPGYGPPQFPEGRGPGQGQGQGQGPEQGQGGGSFFRGPQEYFEEWHRQAHAADAQPQSQPQAPAAPAAPVTPAQPAAPAPAPEAPASGNGETVR
jgi:hypothetical protein